MFVRSKPPQAYYHADCVASLLIMSPRVTFERNAEDRVWPEIMILCTLPPTGLKVRVERGLSGDMLAVPAPVALFLSALVARVKRGQPQW
jgi:hypothetical protein